MNPKNQLTQGLLELQNSSNYNPPSNDNLFHPDFSPLKRSNQSKTYNEERELKKQFFPFYHPKNTNKIESFLTWMDSDKKFQSKNIYPLVKKHYFSYDGPDSIKLLQEKTSIFDLIFTKDENYLIFASENSIFIKNLKEDLIIKTLKGHSSKISSVLLNYLPGQTNPNIFSAGYDSFVIMWNWEGDLLYTFKGHEEPVLSIAITQDKLFSAGEDKSILVYDISSKTQILKLEGHKSTINQIILDEKKNYVFSAGWDTNVMIWDYTLGVKIKELKGHKDLVRCLALNPSRNQLASGGNDKKILLWDLNSYQLLHTFQGHTHTIRAIIWTLDGKKIISGSWDKTIRVWKLENKKQIECLEGHTDSIRSLWMSNDGNTLISGCWDGSVRSWNLQERGDEMQSDFFGIYEQKDKFYSLECDSTIYCFALNKSKSKLFTGDQNSMIKIYKCKGAMKFLKKLESSNPDDQHVGYILTLCLSPDETKLFSGSTDNSFKIWDWKKSRLIKSIKYFTNWVTSISIAKNSKFFMVGALDKSCSVYNYEDYNIIDSFNLGEVAATIFTNDSETGIIVGDRNEIKVFETKDLNKNYFFYVNESDAPIKCVQITNDGKKLFIGTHNGKILVLDLSKKICITTLIGHSDSVNSLKITDSQNELISGGNDGKLILWNIEDLKEISRITVGEKINCLEIGKDCLEIFIATNAKSILTYKWDDEQKIQFLKGHTGQICSIAISPCQKFIATGGRDFWVCLWDIETFQLIHTFKGHSWIIWTLCFTSDSKKICSSEYSSYTKLWDVKKKKLIKTWYLGSTECVVSDNKSTRIIVSSCDCYIRIMDLIDLIKNNPIAQLEGHSAPAISLVVSKKDDFLFSGGKDKLIIKWDLSKYEKINKIQAHDSDVLNLFLSNDQILYSSCKDGEIKTWKTENLVNIDKININLSRIKSVTPDKLKTKIAIDDGKQLLILDLVTKSVVNSKVYKNEDQYIGNGVGYCENDIITFTHRRISYLDGLNLNKKKKTILLANECFSAQTLSLDSTKWIFSKSSNDYLYIWDLLSNQLVIKLKGHQDRVNKIVVTWNNKIVSCSEDKTIRVWSLEKPKNPLILNGHSSGVKSFIIYNEKIYSVSHDKTIRIWNIETGKQEKVFSTHRFLLSTIDINLISKKIYLGSVNNKIIELDIEKEDLKTVGISNSSVNGLVVSPDGEIIIVINSNSQIQIWKTENFCFIQILPTKFLENKNILPVFLTDNHRFVLYFNMIFDVINGNLIFSFHTNTTLNYYFFDKKSFNYFYINKDHELIKYNKSWFQKYFYHYINYDSLSSIPRKDEVLSNQNASIYPFLFKYLHFSAIYEVSENLTIKKIQEKYNNEKLSLNIFYNNDIFNNTPLDILLCKKNVSLIEKLFELIFIMIDDPLMPFYEKVNFLNYNFNKDKNILDFICSLFPLCGDDFSIISKLFDRSFLEIDRSIYPHNLSYPELDEPIILEIDSIYNTDKKLIKKKLNEHLKIKKKEKEDDEEEEIQKCAVIKSKIICLPKIFDINDQRTSEIIGNLAELEPDNEIFSNKVLSMIINYIWINEIKSYYIIELIIFLVFFLLFNINYILLFPNRIANESLTDFSITIIASFIDIVIIIFAFYCLANESIQLRSSGLSGYFKSIWNYVDILLIPLMLTSSTMSLLLTFYLNDYDECLPYFKLFFAITMFCFWFRFISFFRGFKETSYMIRLIFNVIVGVRFFVLFMILFMATLASTFFLLHSKEDSSESESTEETLNPIGYWTSFFAFYSSTVGNSDGITDFNIDFPVLTNFFMIASTFLFAIILLNLLVAIIGDKHGEINDAEEMTRTFEITNIVSDVNSSIIAKIVRTLRGRKKFGNYLLYLFNDKHDKKEINIYEGLENNINGKINEIQDRVKIDLEKIVEDKVNSLESSLKKELEKFIIEKNEAICKTILEGNEKIFFKYMESLKKNN